MQPSATLKPGVVPAPAPPGHRGAKKGAKRGPSRAPEIVFRGKMESTFKTANRLLEKLASLRDSRQVRGNEASAKQYLAFVLNHGQDDPLPVGVADAVCSESLTDWI